MPRAFVMGFLLVAIAACGDDDGAPTDAGRDAARADAGDSGGFIPRRDSSVIEGDPVPDCDRLDPLACGAGQKCDWVLRAIAGQLFVYTGCVDEQSERELGVPCEPWARVYEVPGLADETYVDPCAEDLFCAPHPTLRDVNSCQPICDSLSDCEDNAFCAGTPTSDAITVCRSSDDCDALTPSGCASGENCYLRPNGPYDGPLSICLAHSPFTTSPGAPGDPCVMNGAQYISACEAGAVCWGDPRLLPSQWMDGDIRCRSYCDPASDGSDAGSAQCGAGECVWLGDPALGLNVSGLTVQPGVCD